MPTRAGQRERVPDRHPRLFLRPEDLPRLRELARGRERARFHVLRSEADGIIATGPTPEPSERGSARDKTDKQAVAYWWPNREQTLKACREAETLAFVYLITGEKKYGEAASRWILHLASWDPDGPTNFTLNCEAAKPLLHRLPRAYDWAYDALTPAVREKVRAAMRRRASDAWNSWEVARGVGHLNSPYGSHANRTWHKLAECAIALLGEVPEAESWLDYAVHKFYAAYPVWSDDDGGWHEGVSYWGGYLSKVVWWLEVARTALGIDGFKKPFFAQVGDFPLYVAPPHSPNIGFGDQSHRTPPESWGRFMEYFIRVQGGRDARDRASYWHWWTREWKMESEDGILGFLFNAQLPEMPRATPPSALPPSKVFRGIGVASLHRSLLSSLDDVHFLFKSSPFGTQSHGHNPHNSFQLNAYGESLLTTCVYRDLHGSRFHYEWAHSTVAHNAVLVNGTGQRKHTPSADGRIVDFELSPKWDYVVGDATDAYEGRLERYRRHVVFLRDPGIVVLYDDLAAKEPSTYHFMLHANRAFSVDEDKLRVRVDLPKAGVAGQYLSPVAVKFRQWDGYDPPPEFREFPNQWHLEASTAEKRKEAGVWTVIAPYRAGQQRDWTAERIESDTAVGVRIRGLDHPITVAIRKEGVTGAAEVEGIRFQSAFVVRQP